MKTFVRALATLVLLTTGAAHAARPSHGITVTEQPVPSQDLPNIDLAAEESATPTLKRRDTTEKSKVSLVPVKRGENAKRFSGLSFRDAMSRQLPTLAAQVGVEDASRLALVPSRETTNALGQRVVTFQQHLDGVEIFRGDVAALFARDHRLVATSGEARTQLGEQRRADFAFDAAQAVSLAYADLAGLPLDAGLLVKRGEKNGYDTFTSNVLTDVTHRPLASPARAKRVLFPVNGSLIPSWYVEVELAHPTQRRPVAYSYVISAISKPGPLGRGTVLLRNNLVADADLTFRVWADTTAPFTPHDGPTGTEATPYPRAAFDPNAPYGPYVAPNLVTIPRAPNARGDNWLAEGATTTSGNNVRAYADLAAPDYFSAGDMWGTTSAPDTFDYTFDPLLQPGSSTNQRQAAIAQLFFTNNWLHDAFYEAGFDEAAKNAQLDNYGRGGVAGDPVEAQAQDYSGTDNANMLTPADGTSPRMQMYVFNGFVVTELTVTAPAAIAGTYDTAGTIGAPTYAIAGDLVRAAPTAACGISNAAAVSGKIAIIDFTQTCNPVNVIVASQSAGALGFVMVYNDPEDPDFTPAITGNVPSVTIPGIVVSYNTAMTFDAALESSAVSITMSSIKETNLDGTVDNAIVAHEWGHYLTNRLVGNGSGLTTKQARGMGEGWGDFVALLTLVREEDAANPHNVNWSGAFPMSTYATRGFNGTWADYFGIRRIPYSTDRSKNALTFKHIDDSQSLPTGAPMLSSGLENSQVHNAGEVWATALWEAYVSLLRAHPFAEAQTRMRNYLVAGLKLTPIAPTFTEARDALLAAAFANDPADYARMGAAFASRGMGAGAISAPRDTTTNDGVVESYSTGAFPQIVSYELTEDTTVQYCDRDGAIDSGEAALLSVKIRNTGWQRLEAGTLDVTSNVTGADGSVATPALEIGEEATVSLTLNPVFTSSPETLTLTLSPTAPGLDSPPAPTTFSVNANFDMAPAVVETVDMHPEYPTWTMTATPSDDLGWDYVYIWPENADDLLFYGPNNGEISDLSLVTPPIAVGSANFSLTFDHLFSFEAYDDGAGGLEAYDGAVIELSTDGTTWVDVGDRIVSGPGYNAVIEAGYDNPLTGRPAISGRSPDLLPDFVLHATTLDFGTDYANQTVRIRFRVGTDEFIEELGWAVDNVTVSGATAAPFLEMVAEDGVCQNRQHTVDAGADQTVDERTTVTLTGTVSDPDPTNSHVYAWTQTAGPAATLTGADTATLSFIAPEVTANATLTFQLTVSDADFTATDTVTVSVRHVNRAPTALAGEDATVDEREVATVIGLGTDPDGDALTFEWTQIAGPEAISGPVEGALLSFVAPEVTVDTDFTFRLTVTDGALSATDDITFTVRQVNRLPVLTLVGEAAISANEGSTIELSVTAEDADADPVGVTWTQLSGPPATLAGADSETVSVTLPSIQRVSDVVVFQAVPNDGLEDGAPVTVTVTIVDQGGNEDGMPTVTINPIGDVPSGATGTLTAVAKDPQGGTLSYAWEQTGGTPVTLLPANDVLRFTAPRVAENSTLTFQVTVTSSESGLSASATATTTLVASEDHDDDETGCGCTSANPASMLPAGLAFLALAFRRRRSVS